MVDRITPVTTDDDRALVRDRFGIDDGWPVVCEPFTQWVLEDALQPGPAAVRGRRRAGRGRRRAVRADEAAAAQREPPGTLLLRLPGRLPAGARRCQDPLFAEFLLAYMDSEATPTLEPVPGIDLDEYKHRSSTASPTPR